MCCCSAPALTLPRASHTDHTENKTLFELLQVEKHTGMKLTDSLAMYPAASVSALILAHPDSAYFATGPVCADQIKDYSERKGSDVTTVERWLKHTLAYEVALPDDDDDAAAAAGGAADGAGGGAGAGAGAGAASAAKK